MLIFFFYIISFSILGYGFFLSKLLKIETNELGYIGILGLSFLIFFSYFSSIFLPHNYQFNFLTFSIGIIFFIYFLNVNFVSIKKELKIFLIIFSILVIFILLGKNHDDFPHYHFPYSYLLTQYSHPIGIGWLNNGFRNPSSLFFLNSLFYLPKVDYYLFHISPAYFLGFSNLILLKLIFNKDIFKKINLINFLSLLIFLFINIFFYRLAEHGTDRSGQILVLIIVILFISISNNPKNQLIKNDNTKIIYLICILLSILISLKTFYLIYSPIILLIFFYSYLFKEIKKFLFSRTIIYCLFFSIFVFFYNFINSSCLIYPANFTCFSDLPWSFDAKIIKDVNEWYELWAKAGATPNYIVEDRAHYISKLNWLPNWLENYFFNKVSDFLLGLLVLILITYFFFKKKNLKKDPKKKFNIFTIYIIIILLFVEWFFKHPALRYGGYQLIALLFFIPIASVLSSYRIKYDFFMKKSLILVLVCLTIFVTRNLFRLNDEYKLYNYNPFNNINYKIDEKFYFRYMTLIENNKENYSNIMFFGKKFMLTKKK